MNGVVKKAVVLTAGMGLRSLPATKAVPKALLTVFDRPAVQWVCEEAAQSGAREILLVVAPDGAVKKHFSKDEALERALAEQNKLNELAAVSALARLNVDFAVQQSAGGSGEALLCAREFAGDKPFFLLNFFCARGSRRALSWPRAMPSRVCLRSGRLKEVRDLAATEY